MQQKPHPLDWIFLSSLVVAWGSSFAMTKVAVAHLDASWIMALRLAIAAAVLVPYAYATGQALPASLAPWKKFTWLGLIGHAAPFFLISWGTHFVSSGVSGLLMGAIPLFLVVLAHFTLPDEPLTIPKSIGFLLGFAGIIVLIGPSALLNLSMSGSELKGELAILAGGLCYAVHAVSAKRLGFDHPVKQTASVCLVGAIIGLAFAGLVSPNGLQDIPASAWISVAGLGILPTAIASLLMYHLIQRSGPSFVAFSNYLVPVYAVVLGAIVLNETLGWNILLAMVLVLSGIAISRIAPKSASS